MPGVKETAAIAVPPPDGGPDQLVLYCVLKEPAGCAHIGLRLVDCGGAGLIVDPSELKKALQNAIKHKLNPLFRVAKVNCMCCQLRSVIGAALQAMIVDALPRTASNKVMRRILRQASLSNDLSQLAAHSPKRAATNQTGND